MEWNNGKERAMFEKEQAELRKKYIAAGMTEEQIKILRDYDEKWFRKRRNETLHIQELDIRTSEDEDNKDSPLLKKMSHNFSVVDKHFENDRFGWIEQIEDKKLYIAVSLLSKNDKEMLTKYLYDGFTQTELAQSDGVVKVVICKKIKRIKNFLKKFLENG